MDRVLGGMMMQKCPRARARAPTWCRMLEDGWDAGGMMMQKCPRARARAPTLWNSPVMNKDLAYLLSPLSAVSEASPLYSLMAR